MSAANNNKPPQGLEASDSPALNAGDFSYWEVVALNAVRTVYNQHALEENYGIDQRRLEFARYLVEHRLINEGEEPYALPVNPVEAA